MARGEFLESLRVARSLMIAPKVQTDSPDLDPTAIQKGLARCDIWLTPASVAGFDAADFPELTLPEKQELADYVAQFRAIARAVPGNKPARPEQVKTTAPLLRRILEIMAPFLEVGSEDRAVRTAIERVVSSEFPDFVAGFHHELGEDSSGEPAVWVWVVVNDDAAGEQDFDARAAIVRDRIQQAVLQADVKRWAYVSFRAAAEQRTISNAR